MAKSIFSDEERKYILRCARTASEEFLKEAKADPQGELERKAAMDTSHIATTFEISSKVIADCIPRFEAGSELATYTLIEGSFRCSWGKNSSLHSEYGKLEGFLKRYKEAYD